MKCINAAAIAVSVSLLAAGMALAQAGQGRSDGSCGAGRLFDPKTVETVHGDVASVEQIHGQGCGQGRRGRGAGYGVHLTLKTGDGQIPVHVGPNWFLEKQGLTIAPGDEIEVTGSRVVFEGAPVIIAAQITTGGQTVRLREDSGVPVWSGPPQR
jgi:hypothetical protein